MAANLTWLLNLDAERELQQPAGYGVSAEIAARIRALASRMSWLIGSDDMLLLPEPGPPRAVSLRQLAEGAETAQRMHVPVTALPRPVLCFCPTPWALAWLAQRGLPPPSAPALSVLRAVNSRAFCAGLGQVLPHACYVRTLKELQTCLALPSPSGRWVLKRDFAFAGRERRWVQDGQLDAASRGFVTRSFAQGEGLQVEPWLERLQDLAQHGYLLRDGSLRIGPPMRQWVDARGAWLRSEPCAADELTADERRLLDRELRATAVALRDAGYFGPFGIDGFRYRHPTGRVEVAARVEINARFSMGYPRALLDQALASAQLP